ncbi:hypothetical protein CANCADRAFT_18384, partial [Tortispora caseinolytica NRRL Y-17796]
LKKKLRDTERILKKQGIPETIKRAAERKLKDFKDQLKEREDRLKNDKMAKKYKMVKFFEQKKTLRKLKTCISQVDGASDQEKAKLHDLADQYKTNLAYIKYYPTGKKYIALY